MRTAIVLIAMLFAIDAYGQQYQNLEIQPNGTGGYSGTYGRRNFEVYPQNGASTGQIGRRPGAMREQPSNRRGSVGGTRGNCVVDSNGRAFCR
jgi:hypothetical protein